MSVLSINENLTEDQINKKGIDTNRVQHTHLLGTTEKIRTNESQLAERNGERTARGGQPWERITLHNI